MKNRKFVFALMFGFFFFCGALTAKLNAQSVPNDNKKIYMDLLKANKLEELFIHLQKWETADSKNPEVYAAWFNYYARLGSSSITAMGKTDRGRFEIYNQENYFEQNVYKGISYLDKGLEYGKNRLDMYFGKISVLNKIEDYQRAGEEAIKVLELSKEINNSWLWADNRVVENGEGVLLNSLGNYYEVWINAETEISLGTLEKCAVKQIALYPRHIETYNYLSVCYLIRDDYNSAIRYLEMALAIDENDSIILINLGRAYMTTGNNAKAKEYFSKVTSIGNDEEKRYAQSFLDRL